jgi:hypothetical protein
LEVRGKCRRQMKIFLIYSLLKATISRAFGYHTVRCEVSFESSTSANSITPAHWAS